MTADNNASGLALAIVDELKLAVGLAQAVMYLDSFGLNSDEAKDRLSSFLTDLHKDARRLQDMLTA